MWFGTYWIASNVIDYRPNDITEECGILVGRRRGLRTYVEGLVTVINRAESSSDTFEIWRVDVSTDTLDNAVGAWHSHPVGGALPSDADVGAVGGLFRFGLITTPQRDVCVYGAGGVLHHRIALSHR